MTFTLSVNADGGYQASIPVAITTALGIVTVPATITTATWAADRTYLINQDSGVPVGSILTIQPGTVVRFAPNTSLSIAGTLIADGTQAQPIRLARQATTGTWGKLNFLDSSVGATFDGGGNYIGSSILRNMIVEDGQGINLANASFYLLRPIRGQICFNSPHEANLSALDEAIVYGQSSDQGRLMGMNNVLWTRSLRGDAGAMILALAQSVGDTTL